MSLQIVGLGEGQVDEDEELDDLYEVDTGKTAIVKSMRFANTDEANIQTINVYFTKAEQEPRLIAPANLSLMPGMVAVDDQEITMEAGDKIQAVASEVEVIDYVISGVERDV